MQFNLTKLKQRKVTWLEGANTSMRSMAKGERSARELLSLSSLEGQTSRQQGSTRLGKVCDRGARGAVEERHQGEGRIIRRGLSHAI